MLLLKLILKRNYRVIIGIRGLFRHMKVLVHFIVKNIFDKK